MRHTGLVLAFLLMPLPTLAADEIDQAKIARVKVNVVENVDRFTGTAVVAARRTLALDKVGLLTTLTLNPAVLQKEGGPPSFYAVMNYTGYGWLFLTGRVDVLVDGARFQLQGLASSSDREVATCSAGAGCIVEEKIRFVMTKGLADALGNARSAEIRAVGSKGSVDGQLNEKHIAYFRAMAARYAAMGGNYTNEDLPAQAQADGAREPPEVAAGEQESPPKENDADGTGSKAPKQGSGWRDWAKR